MQINAILSGCTIDGEAQKAGSDGNICPTECHDVIKGAIIHCAADCAACHIDTVPALAALPMCPSRLAQPTGDVMRLVAPVPFA